MARAFFFFFKGISWQAIFSYVLSLNITSLFVFAYIFTHFCKSICRMSLEKKILLQTLLQNIPRLYSFSTPPLLTASQATTLPHLACCYSLLKGPLASTLLPTIQPQANNQDSTALLKISIFPLIHSTFSTGTFLLLLKCLTSGPLYDLFLLRGVCFPANCGKLLLTTISLFRIPASQS